MGMLDMLVDMTTPVLTHSLQASRTIVEPRSIVAKSARLSTMMVA
jgi:hypothetical protein